MLALKYKSTYLGKTDFYNRYVRFENPEQIVNQHCTNQNTRVKTKVAIKCNGIEFDSTRKEIRAKLGAANFEQKADLKGFSVMLYRIQSGKLKFTIVYYLVHDRMIFAQFILSSKSQKHCTDLINSISMKYLSMPIMNQLADLNLVDQNGSKLWTSNLFNTVVNYKPAFIKNADIPINSNGILRIV